jgi:hypothetical protein
MTIQFTYCLNEHGSIRIMFTTVRLDSIDRLYLSHECYHLTSRTNQSNIFRFQPATEVSHDKQDFYLKISFAFTRMNFNRTVL